MTVVVWDGKTLAADKQASQGDLRRTVTKIRRIRGHLCAVAGDWDRGQEMFDWFEKGADTESVPHFMRTENDWVSLLVITPDGRCLKYERSPYPMDFTESVEKDGFYAFGSGRDFAIGALAWGASASGAVKVANIHCPSCGMGVDTLTLVEQWK